MIELAMLVFQLFGAIIAGLGVFGLLLALLWIVAVEITRLIQGVRLTVADNRMFKQIEEFRNDFA